MIAMRLRNLLLVIGLLCAFTARAQFADVEWSSQRCDSLLPVCTQVIDLPADYASYSYSARIEYPEYQRMTAEEVARYSLADKYPAMPAEPVVECHVGVQAKQAQLDIAFVPVVMRDGGYYRVNSYKLVVDRVPAPQRSAATRSAAERYAASSVLATGKWVMVSVTDNGIHKITHNELRKMGFKDPAKVRLYGYGGHMLPEKGLADLPDDLCEVPLWRESNYVLFYANGVVDWSYSRPTYVHTRNVYSEYGCYFLTEGDVQPMEFPTATLQALGTTEYSTFTDYALYEKDLKSLCSYGRVLVDNYDYSQGRTVSYRFPVEGVVDGKGSVYVSFATNGLDASRVDISLGGNSLGSISLSRCTGGEVGKMASRNFTVSNGLADNPVVKLSHAVQNNGVNGFLDYISLNFTRRLALYGSQTLFRGADTAGNALFKIDGCNANTRVWDVSGSAPAIELVGKLEGTVYSVVAPGSAEGDLVVFDTKGSFPSVKMVGDVPNQDLHAMEQVDMVIIVPSNGSFIAAAERLADAHRSMEGLKVKVVTAQQVYNEFSSGTPDVTAYRRLMKMLYDRASTAADAPKYLLLFGDAWFDNRLITFAGRKQSDYLLCYESMNSVDAIDSYVLEDYMGFLDDSEGSNHQRDKVDVGIGRFPVQSVVEANAVVDKTISYMQNRNAGAWQNVVTLLADDGDKTIPNQHMKDADSIVAVLDRYYPSYVADRIYWDDFSPESTASGLRYPAVTQAIYDRLDEGALVVNYSGHGSANLLSHELVWKASDMAALKSPRLPFWVTASCDIGPFDIGDNSLAESALLNPYGAAVGLLTTTRTVYQSYNTIINKTFMRELLMSVETGETDAVGDAVRRAKCKVITAGSDVSVNKLQYVLMCDPALRLKIPQYKVVVDRFDGKDASVAGKASAGGLLAVEGRVLRRDGSVAEDFTGLLYSTFYDSKEQVNTRDNTGLGSYSYTAYNKKLFSGSDSIVGGRFSFTVPVPMDISYRDEQGLLSLFAVDSSYMYSAQGRYDNFVVGGTAQDIVNDGKGPDMKLYLNTPSFVDGDEVNPTPCLWAELYDENGINTVGNGIGHNITAVVDNSPHHTYDLNGLFVSEAGDYKRGTIMLPLEYLEPGEHSLVLRAWDLYNNSSVARLSFVVNPSLAPDFVQLRLNPSPVVYGSNATFELTHNRPQSELEVAIDIFDFQGQTLWSNTTTAVCDGLVYTCNWDGTAQGGQPLATGVYLARAYIAVDGVESATRAIKIVVINNK